jgi:serine/threonine-protein kinase HipA
MILPASAGQSFSALNPVDQLALVGRQGRGAFIFQPESLSVADSVNAIDLDALADETRAILLGEASIIDDMMARLGGGSGGARPKVHVSLYNDGRIGVGDQRPGEGARSAASQWIIKFPALSDPPDIGPVEEAYARMAQLAGIAMAETRLIPSANGPGHFATRRFDRPGENKRVHMISLGGAMEASPQMPSLDYDGFLKATLSITRDMRDVEQAFRRMVFNVLSHNRDDHVRQHAYLMDETGQWHLSPAFDLTFSNGPGGEHYMAVMGEGRAVTRAHVEALGRKHGLTAKRIDQIIGDVTQALQHWPAIAIDTGVGGSFNEIERRLEAVSAAFG